MSVVQEQNVAMPKHEWLRSHLLTELKSGRLKPGQPLPTEIELAASMSMARNTVRQALGELERGGWIRRVRGKGTFVNEAPAPTAMPVASARPGTQTITLGLIVPDGRAGFYPSLQKGFAAAADELRCHAIISDSDNDIYKQADVLFQLMDRRVSGIAMVPASRGVSSAHQLRQLQAAGVPVVLLHREVEGVRAPCLGLPHEAIGCEVVQTLLRRGYRRLACCFPHASPTMDKYLAGIRRAMGEAGLELRDGLVYAGEEFSFPPPQAHVTGLQAWLERIVRDGGEGPLAIWSSYDPDAELLLLLLAEMGLKVPADVAVLSFGGSWRGTAVRQRISSITFDEVSAGRTAAEWLEQMCGGKQPIESDKRVAISIGLHDGATLGSVAS